eukprot:8696596-Heterocapsa_arctica.AAC.1
MISGRVEMRRKRLAATGNSIQEPRGGQKDHLAAMTKHSTLKSCMFVIHGYKGLTHSCKEVESDYVLDLKYWYLIKDVPLGMCFNKGFCSRTSASRCR